MSDLSEWLSPKSLQATNAGKDADKREPQNTAVNVNWCSHYGEQYVAVIKKSLIELPYMTQQFYF